MSDLQKQLDILATDGKARADFSKRVSEGDVSTLPVIRKVLEVADNVDRYGGNLAKQTEETLINAFAGNDMLGKEALFRKMKVMRDELAGANPTPLEKLLAERIALCWLALHDAEIRFTRLGSMAIVQADFWQRRIDHLHRRYLTAIKTLATVRKLAIPVLQVNIARKQVNMAGNCTATENNGKAPSPQATNTEAPGRPALSSQEEAKQ